MIDSSLLLSCWLKPLLQATPCGPWLCNTGAAWPSSAECTPYGVKPEPSRASPSAGANARGWNRMKRLSRNS
ncbi:hypothetical protein V2P20_01580 [Methylobacter sp. Wu1]|uniref:hypothetical protein n=1 Tax=Methylobacter sp. Wu1 TaxID=3119359 RepID=UPI002F95EC18